MGDSEFLQLDRAGAPSGDLTGWLAAAVHAAVADGRLPVGSRLPSTRVLARDLGVSRGVVVGAYQRLVDSGVATGHGAAGTRIAARPAQAPPAAPPPRPFDGVDLTPGVPDLAAFPRAAWLRAERSVLTDLSAADLGYGDPRGHPVLRRELAAWLGRTRGVRADPDAVVVVAGVAQALALLAQVLTADGRTAIAVEDPGSQGTREEVAFWGMEPVPVPVDDDGIHVAALRRSGAPTVLLTPAHQFPTGVVLAPARRRALLGWVADGGLVVEDDYDAEHRYDRAPVPALQGLAPAGVVHIGSTSKSLAPGMRIGWMVVPQRLREPLAHLKWMSDLGNATLPQLVLARLIGSGEVERHVRRVRPRQRARRDAMRAALAELLPAARVHGVAAGMHLLVTFAATADPVADDRVLADRARAAGVLVQPLSRHRIVPGPPGLVLGYAAQPPDRIRHAVAALAQCCEPRHSTTLRHVPRLRRAVLAAVLVLVLVTVAGCGGSASNTDCGINGCTITFPRSGDAAVSVLGVSARLLGVQEGQATLEVAGQTVSVPVGGETQAQGFTVAVESVTDTEVVVRVTAG